MATHNHHLLPLYSLLIIIFITISSLLPCFSSTIILLEDLQSENQMMEVFHQWQLKHPKSYYNDEEELNRFENFKRNVKYVVENESSRVEPYNKVGLNRFSDLSSEEFKERCLSGVKSWDQVSSGTLEGFISSCDAPPYLDWRTMGEVVPVDDHGVCGSSRTFSSIRLVEDNHVETKIVSTDGYANVEETEKALLCATVNQPISVGIDGSSMDFQLYTGGIYDGACSSNPNDINHEVLIVGYGSEGSTDYWIVKNSWGTNWGMDGYIYIRRNANLPYGVCAINTLASYSLQSALASSPIPSPDAPPYFPPPQPLQPPPAPSSPPSPQFPPPQPLQPPPAPSSPPPQFPPQPLQPPPAPSPPPLYPPLQPLQPPPAPSSPPPQFPPPQPLQPPPAPLSPPPLYPPPQPLQPPPSPSSPPPLFPPPQPLQPPPTTPSPPPHIPPPAPSSPAPQFPPPQPLQPPPAPSSPPVHPPPPPSLPPSKCAEFTYCLPGQTCCCLYESLGFCLIQGCCGHSNAVCCRGSDFCCPLEYPICDADGGVCLKKPGDNMGVALTKKKLAKLALPWSKVDERMETTAYRPLKWRRNGYAAAA